MTGEQGAARAGLLHTPLHALHLALGARLVPFAGYDMPVSYPPGIIHEHEHTRRAASLFDVSHMGQIRIEGAGAAAALERLVPGDIAGLAPGRSRYTVLTNDAAGIVDDLMVTNAGDHLLLVVNAARREADLALLRAALGDRCRVAALAARALLALQGPQARAVMARFSEVAARLPFMSAGPAAVAGIECFVSCSGYTGEDGFELSVGAADAEALARRLLAEPEVEAAGLGARDSLRLEAGLCLYGHELDESTSPIEAGLAWVIPKVRLRGGARAGGFPGAPIIFGQLAGGIGRRRVGLRPEGRAPIREGTELLTPEGAPAGRVTSGGFGPSAGGAIAMGYVSSGLDEPGTMLRAIVRDKPRALTVASLPFVPHRYHRG
jgi:aminomethyltransferase